MSLDTPKRPETSQLSELTDCWLRLNDKTNHETIFLSLSTRVE